MLTVTFIVTQNKFTPYSKIKNKENIIISYPDIFKGKIIETVMKNLKGTDKDVENAIFSLVAGVSKLTNSVFVPKSMLGKVTGLPHSGLPLGVPLACISFDGSVKIIGANVNNKIESDCIKLYQMNYLPNIYTTTMKRISYAKKVYKKLKIKKSNSCIQDNLKLEILGKGSYGNVYKTIGSITEPIFAVKLTKIKKEDKSNNEISFLKSLKPLIEKNICPNLPYLYKSSFCNSCTINIDDKDIKTPCSVIVTELADGHLKNYFVDNTNPKPTLEELYVCLFHIMSGLHAIQKYTQIMNFDIKKENILYYNINSGGYFVYNIRGKDYYVPNFGKLFVINDFGISRTMNIKTPMYKDGSFRLGSRYAMIKDSKFIELDYRKTDVTGVSENISKAEITLGDKKSKGYQYIKTKGKNKTVPNIPKGFNKKTFFSDPETVPPFEFYNDTQDAIRIFTGGKRTTQKGSHKVYDAVHKDLVKKLKPYIGKGESMKSGIFKEPSHVLAGYFIEKFFGEGNIFTVKPEKGNIIAKYVL
jgi:serine/threonine protein kinase